ncbi:Ig-like domain repeat protein [Leifsonia shinshuensis]|uniref:Calx-beta domain-containing protein n=1 Tax=Leifsonia shinshuensis TaxID=150026 RepID=UPI001F50A89D|nr:Calx-beta domain-containing protein [Leifsonia shinshuensis]MCI0157296.1 Ig-like domain repeat protein [Leifsonia shinshuensis]
MTPPHASIRLACALGILVSAAAATLGVIAGPASATPVTPTAPTPTPAPVPPLTPVVDCIQDAPLGAVTSRTVVLGYRSTAAAAMEVPAGTGDNDLGPGAADRGQPSTFLPGEHHGVWLLTLDAAAEPAVTWTIGGATATIDASVPSCTDATAVTLSAPTTVTDGGRVGITAVVSRFLLGAPETGAVAFSVDGAAPTVAPVATGGVARVDLPAPAIGDHTVTAQFVPAAGSSLRPSTSTAALTVAPASGPLTIAVDSVVAGSRSVLVTVTRPSPVGPATAAFTTGDGTAIAGTDYLATAGTVTFADGQSSATATVPLLTREAGAPASRFFVLLTRASIPIAAGVATVSLPAVPAAPAAIGATSTSGGSAAGPSSALPEADPTAPTGVPSGALGQDFLLMLGALLVTAGGIAGVIGLVRAVRSRDAFS